MDLSISKQEGLQIYARCATTSCSFSEPQCANVGWSGIVVQRCSPETRAVVHRIHKSQTLHSRRGPNASQVALALSSASQTTLVTRVAVGFDT
eukprot:5055466-Amphidinium_carterae.1